VFCGVESCAGNPLRSCGREPVFSDFQKQTNTEVLMMSVRRTRARNKFFTTDDANSTLPIEGKTKHKNTRNEADLSEERDNPTETTVYGLVLSVFLFSNQHWCGETSLFLSARRLASLAFPSRTTARMKNRETPGVFLPHPQCCLPRVVSPSRYSKSFNRVV